MADSPIEAGYNFARLLPDNFAIGDDSVLESHGEEVRWL